VIAAAPGGTDAYSFRTAAGVEIDLLAEAPRSSQSRRSRSGAASPKPASTWPATRTGAASSSGIERFPLGDGADVGSGVTHALAAVYFAVMLLFAYGSFYPMRASTRPAPGADAQGTRKVHPVGFRLMSISSAETDTRGFLPRIQVPTLLLWGDRDRRSPVHVAEQLRAAIPGAELAIIPDAGHLSNMEQPEVFNVHVRRFCLSQDTE
jgi:pimeloyl-ACP methyl ester carboxylesterase